MRFSPCNFHSKTVAASSTPSEVALSTNPVLPGALMVFLLLYDLVLSETILSDYVFAPVSVTRAVEWGAGVGIRPVTWS